MPCQVSLRSFTKAEPVDEFIFGFVMGLLTDSTVPLPALHIGHSPLDSESPAGRLVIEDQIICKADQLPLTIEYWNSLVGHLSPPNRPFPGPQTEPFGLLTQAQRHHGGSQLKGFDPTSDLNVCFLWRVSEPAQQNCRLQRAAQIAFILPRIQLTKPLGSICSETGSSNSSQ